MYVGPTERLPTAGPSWVIDAHHSGVGAGTTGATGAARWRMRRAELPAVAPALLKVFDEILVNAADNHQRHPGSCDRIDVVIRRGDAAAAVADAADAAPFVSVANNGRAVPVRMHRKEGMYVPELLFGHLLTGSNFDDDAKRLTGGRHGYGAKLANVFSREFAVEIRDARGKGPCRTYRQVWRDNMRACDAPDIATADSADGAADAEDFTTKVSFVPDVARLTGDPAATVLPEEEYMLMCRRVVDVAGCTGGKLAVTLNGEAVDVADFRSYVDLHRHAPDGAPPPPPVVYRRLNKRWEVAVGVSDARQALEHLSFVNGMHTSRGGTVSLLRWLR